MSEKIKKAVLGIFCGKAMGVKIKLIGLFLLLNMAGNVAAVHQFTMVGIARQLGITPSEASDLQMVREDDVIAIKKMGWESLFVMHLKNGDRVRACNLSGSNLVMRFFSAQKGLSIKVISPKYDEIQEWYEKRERNEVAEEKVEEL